MKKTIVATAVIVTGATLYFPLAARLFENMLCRRYPHLSRKEIRVAYALYLKHAELGLYGTYKEAGTLKVMYKALDEIVLGTPASS